MLLPGLRVEDLYGLPVVVSGLAKVPVTLGLRGHDGKCVVRIAAPGSVPPAKEEPFVPAVENLRNVQRPTRIEAVVRLVVIRFYARDSRQAIGPRLESCIVVRVVEDSVRLVDLEPLGHPAHHHDCRPAGESASPRRTKSSTAFAL